MSKSKNTTIIIVIGIIFSIGATYFITLNQYKPIVTGLENELDTISTKNEHLNSTLSRLTSKSVNQNQTMSELADEIETLREVKTDLELELESLNENLNTTSYDLRKYKNITREFYRVNPIRIGVTANSDSDASFIEDLAEKATQDIHAYCTQEDLPYRFEFEIGNNYGLDDMALSNTLTYDSLGINLVIGHGLDSQCASSLNYVNNNDMLLLSYGSSSNEIAEVDNLYRLAPNDTIHYRANIACMKELGIEHVIVFSDSSGWGDYMSKVAINELEKNDIEVYHIRAHSKEFFNQYIPKLNDRIFNLTKYGYDKLAVQLVGYEEFPLDGWQGYTDIYHVIWFGTRNTIYQ